MDVFFGVYLFVLMCVCLFYYMLTSPVLCGAIWHADVITDYVHTDYSHTFLIHQGIHT